MSDEQRVAPVSKPLDSDAAPTLPDLASPNSSRPDGKSASTPPDEASVSGPRPGSSEPPAGPRKRTRMALRIPDDEVARPQPVRVDGRPGEMSAVESPGFDHARAKGGDVPSGVGQGPRTTGDAAASALADSAILPARIITINPPSPAPVTLESSDADAAAVAEGEDVQLEAEALALVTPRVVPARAAASPTAEPEVMRQDGDVRADTSEGEIFPDDLVAFDATPLPPELEPTLPLVRRRLPSHPPVPPPASKKSSATPPAPRPSKPPLVIVPPHMGSVAPQSPEGSGQRRKGRFWWEELFNDDYLRAAERMTDQQLVREVDFIEQSLAIERGGAMLDLACGTGRHAVELARRGYQVVGFDLSLSMLARASDEAQERRTKLNFVQGDMREMTFAEQFDGVYCWNTSFGYFEEEKNALVVDRIRGALKGGGLLLLDVVNRDFLVRQSPSLAWFEGDGCVCMDEMVVDFITSRMRIKRTMMLDDGRSREIEYSMRVYSLHELGKMLHEHGFKVCEVSGRTATPGVFLGHESPRTIVLAEKR
jgi:SAM-dependent methyltransferase